MKTFTQLRNTTAKNCNISTSDTVKMTLIDERINDSIRTINNIQGGKLRFLEATKDMTTVASQSPYEIPNGFRKLIDLQVYSGSAGASSESVYAPEMIFDPIKWKRVQQMQLGTSNVPLFSYVENRRFFLAPTPSTTGKLIRLRGRLQTRDLSIADYSAGTIVSIANAGTALIGSGTTWTADMVGRYIQITQTTAAGGGDGFWYEIGSYTSATSIGLKKPYEGTTIAAGSAAYTIGQCSVIPEAYDSAIIYRSTAQHWDNANDLVRGKIYWMKYDGGNEAGYSEDYGGLIGQMIDNEGETEEGSYIPPFGSEGSSAPYYQPSQNASGLT